MEFATLCSSDGLYSLKVCPQRGGIITSLRWKDQELLYLDESTLVDPSKNVRGGVPLLFPICGPLRDPGYSHQGRNYAMSQHGFARKSPFEICVLPDHLLLRLEATPHTLEQYPFPFEMSIRLDFDEERLNFRTTVVNHSEETMPYQWGAHPYFAVGDLTKLSLEIAADSQKDNTKPSRPQTPLDEPLPLNQVEIDREYHHKPGQTRLALLNDNSLGRQIRLGYDDSFDYVVVWSQSQKNFLCLEPWTGPRYGFQDGQLHTLAAGQSRCHHFWIDCQPLP